MKVSKKVTSAVSDVLVNVSNSFPLANSAVNEWVKTSEFTEFMNEYMAISMDQFDKGCEAGLRIQQAYENGGSDLKPAIKSYGKLLVSSYKKGLTLQKKQFLISLRFMTKVYPAVGKDIVNTIKSKVA